MGEFKEIHLTGGSFFTLIIRGCYKKLSSSEKASGNSDPMSNRSIMVGLMQICDPQIDTHFLESRSMTELCSKYKNCSLSYSKTYLPFNDDSTTVLKMRESLKNDVLKIYIRTKKFVNTYIDLERNGIELASALRKMIILDKNISDNELIYIDSNEKKYISKQTLIDNYKEIDLISLISGIWCYIIDKQIDNNLGKNTVNSWYPNGKNSAMKCDIWYDDGSITLKEIQNELKEEFIDDKVEVNTNNKSDLSNDNEDNIEIIGIKKEEESSKDSPIPTPTIVFHQYGNNGTQIAHIENYYANSTKKDDK